MFTAQAPIDAKPRASTSLEVNAILTRELIIEIATDLKKMADSEQRNRSAGLQTRPQPQNRVTSGGHRTKSSNRDRSKEGKKQ